jgi:hypothetical protein
MHWATQALPQKRRLQTSSRKVPYLASIWGVCKKSPGRVQRALGRVQKALGRVKRAFGRERAVCEGVPFSLWAYVCGRKRRERRDY